MKLHLEVLGRSQGAVLRRLAPVASAKDFYLAGGTALALQLGHRHSVDFDWFRRRPIRDPLQLARGITAAGTRLRVDPTEPGTTSRRPSAAGFETRVPVPAARRGEAAGGSHR